MEIVLGQNAYVETHRVLAIMLTDAVGGIASE